MVQDFLFEAVRSQRKLECMVIHSCKMGMHSDSYNEQVQYCKNKTGRDKEEQRISATCLLSTMKKILP